MSIFESLPVILVSAAKKANATALIAELIDDDITHQYEVHNHSADRVWRITNKYYTANVRFHPLTDDEELDISPDNIEAHIIYMSQEEAAADQCAPAVVRARLGVWRPSHVRLLLCDVTSEPRALAAWALAQRAELLALRAPAADPGDVGVPRARAALHAHVWPGLVRTDGEGGPWDERAADAVEQAEAFAAALEALGEAARARHDEREPRTRRADHVLRALCRALALDD